MLAEALNPEICFDTPSGRVCLPIAAHGPTVPALGDKFIVSEGAAALRRLLDFEAILADTVNNGEGACAGRAQLARAAESVYAEAEDANLRAGVLVSRFAQEIAARVVRFSRDENLPREVRETFGRWCAQHPDLAAYIASLPQAVAVALDRHRQATDTALADFAAGKPAHVAITCEGSTESCAVLGFLAGAAAFTRNVVAGAVAVGGIAWCCS